MNDDERKKSIIEGIDRILQIRKEELLSDRERVIFYMIRHREVITGFRNKIFGSAAAIATLLTALLTVFVAFKAIHSYFWVILTVLIIDLTIVAR